MTKRQRANKLRGLLKDEYTQGWRAHHQKISEYIQPRRARFLPEDRAQAGNRQNDKIINNAATEASDTLRAGITSGTASAVRPWFRLTTRDPKLAEDSEAKEWLYEAELIVQGVIAKSNFYLRIEELYGDLGDFGTAVLHIEEDEKEVIRCYVFPVGSYYLGQSDRGAVDTIFRDVPMTVAQLVKKFTYEKCCLQVRMAYDQHDLYKYFAVVHYIMPNEEYVEGALEKGKKWVSCWYEEQRTDDEGMLHEGGFDYFPVMAPRWKVTGSDVYGSSCGMNALGDAQALQHLEEQKMGMVDKVVNPPLNVPESMRGRQASLLPGAENYVGRAGEKIEPAIIVHPQAMSYSLELIHEHENRIRISYHADLFRLLDALDKGQMTAFEVQERIREKMQLIGPAYERVEEELLDPAIDAILNILFDNFMLPPIPDSMKGVEIKVEYVSIIAQAQKAAGVGALREILEVLGRAFAVDPDVLDIVDLDKLIRDYADKLGIPPKLLRSPEAVVAIREAKAKMVAQQQAQEQAGQFAQGAKVLSETDTSGKNALTDMLQPTGRV